MSTRALSLFIGRRYASLGQASSLTGFISRLSVSGLTLGVAILIMVFSIINGFDRELRQKILALLPHISVSTMQGYPLMSLQEWQPVVDELRNHPEITGLAPQVNLQGMLLANGSSKGVIVTGIMPAQEQQVSILDRFVAGEGLDSLLQGEFNILIGSALAEALALEVGDSLILVSSEMPLTLFGSTPSRKKFTVSGIFTVGSEIDSTLVYANLEDVARLYRLGDGIHGLRIQVTDLFRTVDVATDIRPLLPDTTSISHWTYQFGPIYENIRLSKSLVGLLLMMLVAVAAFNVIVSLAMIVRDKQGDIAILRTMGTSQSQISRIFLVQGGIIGLIGTGSGLLLGILLSLGVTDFIAWVEHVLDLKLFNADVYPVNYLPSQLSVQDCLLVGLVSMCLCLLAAIYPALSAARVRPAEALRHE